MKNLILEKNRPKVGVGVIVVKDGRVLLGKRKGAHCEGDWAFPGGHLEFGEAVEDCAGRELTEETGLEALSTHLGPWTSDVMEEDKHYITLFVVVNQFQGELQLKEPHKCDGWAWFECENFPEPLFPSIRTLIEKIGIENLRKMVLSTEKAFIS
jgi:8-oxo-dGTP diphosphatase